MIIQILFQFILYNRPIYVFLATWNITNIHITVIAYIWLFICQIKYELLSAKIPLCKRGGLPSLPIPVSSSSGSESFILFSVKLVYLVPLCTTEQASEVWSGQSPNRPISYRLYTYDLVPAICPGKYQHVSFPNCVILCSCDMTLSREEQV